MKRTTKAIDNFYGGDISRYPVESDGHNFSQSQIRAICERIDATGECLWHAQAQTVRVARRNQNRAFHFA